MTRFDALTILAAAAGAISCSAPQAPERAPGPEPAGAAAAMAVSHVRVNQLGYRPAGRKVAVVCSLEPTRIDRFSVVDAAGRTALGPLPAREAGPFGPCASTHRLDFSALDREGTYRVRAAGAESPPVRVADDVYDGAADFLLRYMRQQRSGYNPFFGDSVHEDTDALLVDHPTRAGERFHVAGGWADAADYLQYGTTSANATFNLLQAWRDHPAAFGDAYRANGEPGANGVPDVLDEARHGLEWLLRMIPDDELLLHQIGDDRDHAFLDLPTTDSSDYGWGRGGFRPVYPCTGRPQGLIEHRNRSTGKASIAGKYAAALALGARTLEREPQLAERLAARAVVAYRMGKESPGVCQTAPGVAPYFYEEESWADDMELAAAQLHALTGDPGYLDDALEYARMEPVTPWMGQDTARHYEFFPWHNAGHYETYRAAGDDDARALLADFYRRGLAAVADRADNGFLVGIPFIWCSNDLMASFATQAMLYRHMTGDTTFLAHETAALDWILGANPWGVSMVIGLPRDGRWPRDPHSVVARHHGVESQFGGLVDGPVYRSIFQNLLYVSLHEEDELAPFNTGFIVYHDDWGDYSTNEPIMDGTANLAYLFAAMAGEPW